MNKEERIRLHEPSYYIEMKRRKLFEIFEMIKGCSNVVYDTMNLKMNLIIPNPKQDEFDISDLLLTLYEKLDTKSITGEVKPDLRDKIVRTDDEIHYSEWIDEKGNKHLPDRYKVSVAAYALEDTIVHLTHSGAKDIVVTKEDDGLVVTFKR